MTGNYNNLRRALIAQRRVWRQRVILMTLVAVVCAGLPPPDIAAPFAWLVANLIASWIDAWLGYRAVTAPAGKFRLRAATALAFLFSWGVLYGGLGVYMWFHSDKFGQLALYMLCIGGILQNSMAMNDDRRAVFFASSPYALVLVATPAVDLIATPDIGNIALFFGGVVFAGMSYMSISFQLDGAESTRKALRAARRAQHQAQAARRQAQRATEAKSEFLAVMSHEIRTPLNAVVASAHLFDAPDASEEQRQNARLLRRASTALSALLNDVIDITRIEAGKMRLSEQRVDLGSLLRDVSRLWEPRAEEKGLDFPVEIASDLPKTVMADPLRVQQILSNLLSNALKFTSQGHIALRAFWRDGILIVEVEDSGPGVPEDQADRIFGVFEQTEGGSAHAGGAGLGLAISRRLAQLMGGRLELESAPGAGALFRFSAPLEIVASACETSETAPSDICLNGLTVLAADDNEMNRMVLQALLAPRGCLLDLVENGSAAVEAAKAKHYNVILLDMRMPEMDGLEAARRIRETALDRGVPIIAITANAFDAHRRAWEKVGAAGFVPKPIDPDALYALLARFTPESNAA